MASRSDALENESGKASRVRKTDGQITEADRSNSAERGKIIAEVRAELDALAAERRDIGEREKEQKARLKAIGITLKNFNKARHIANLESEDDQSTAMDEFWECMAALGLGEQGDWVKATGGDVANGSGEAKVKAALELEEHTRGYCAGLGREAYKDNKRPADNPFPEGSKPHKLWLGGFVKAQEKTAADMH